jgi:hypothetical protein
VLAEQRDSALPVLVILAGPRQLFLAPAARVTGRQKLRLKSAHVSPRLSLAGMPGEPLPGFGSLGEIAAVLFRRSGAASTRFRGRGHSSDHITRKHVGSRARILPVSFTIRRGFVKDPFIVRAIRQTFIEALCIVR